MRILWVRPAPVGNVAAIVYAFFGLSMFVTFEVLRAQTITLPLGIVFFLFHLNLNLNLPRPDDPILGSLLCIASVASYAATGWITGVATTLLFNVVSSRIGGIDAKFVTAIEDSKEATTSTSAPDPPTLQ